MTPSPQIVKAVKPSPAQEFHVHKVVGGLRPTWLAALRLMDNLRGSASPRAIRQRLDRDAKPAIYFDGRRVFDRRRR